MIKSMNNSIFEAMLTNAFSEYLDERMASVPSDAELAEKFPLPKKKTKWINRRIKERKYNRKRPLKLVYTQRVAIAALVIFSLSFGILSTSPKVQAAIKDTVVEWYEKYIKFNFKSTETAGEEKESQRTLESFNIGYIPSGFTQTESSERIDDRYYMYTNESNDYIIIEIAITDTYGFVADNEKNKYDEISLHGSKAYFMFDDVNQSGAVIWADGAYTITVEGIFNKEELLKIAENIK